MDEARFGLCLVWLADDEDEGDGDKGTVYAMGGLTRDGYTTDGVEKLELHRGPDGKGWVTSNEAWTAGNPMPTARWRFGATAYKGLILVVGGRCWSSSDIKSVDMFQPRGAGGRGQWTTIAELNGGREVYAVFPCSKGILKFSK